MELLTKQLKFTLPDQTFNLAGLGWIPSHNMSLPTSAGKILMSVKLAIPQIYKIP